MRGRSGLALAGVLGVTAESIRRRPRSSGSSPPRGLLKLSTQPHARVHQGRVGKARFQKQSALAQWYLARTADSRLGTRKTMIVALARKLLIALWRFVTTGETLEGVILRPAS